MAKFNKRIEARALRQTGWSIKDIAKHIEVSAASVSIWCREITLSRSQIKALEIKRNLAGYAGRQKGAAVNRNKKINTIRVFRESGRKDLGSLSKRDRFMLGLGLYAGEGFKYGNKAGFTNSDPRLILFMIGWFREFGQVIDARIACQIGINESHFDRIQEVKKYWSRLTGIPQTKFWKPSIKKNEIKKNLFESRVSFWNPCPTYRWQRSIGV